MPEQRHETRAKKSKLAVRYITMGVLMVVWSLIWIAYLLLPDSINGWLFIASGVVFSGIAFAVIGLQAGSIGTKANEDDDGIPPSQPRQPPESERASETGTPANVNDYRVASGS